MRALIPIASGNEDLEVVAITDVLTRGGIAPTIASVGQDRSVRLMQGLRLETDCLLSSVLDQDFDAVVMAGGIPGAMRLGESTELRELLARHHRQHTVLAAICLSPALVLRPAGVLEGCTRVTGNSQQIKTQDETFAPDEFTKRLGDAYDPTLRVCVDTTRRIITSQAPGTAIEFALEVVRMLAGDHVANTIDRYLMVAR